jgi:hypothetical protein
LSEVWARCLKRADNTPLGSGERMRTRAILATRKRRSDRAGELAVRYGSDLDSPHHQRVGRRSNTCMGGRKREGVTSGSCCVGHAHVCPAMRIGHHPDSLSDHRFDLFSAFNHGGGERCVVERGEEIVTPSMETDFESSARKRLDVVRRQSPALSANAHAQLAGDSVALFRCEALDQVRCLMNGVGSTANRGCEIEFRQGAEFQRLRVRAIDEYLEVLPPKAVRFIGSGSTQSKRRIRNSVRGGQVGDDRCERVQRIDVENVLLHDSGAEAVGVRSIFDLEDAPANVLTVVAEETLDVVAVDGGPPVVAEVIADRGGAAKGAEPHRPREPSKAKPQSFDLVSRKVVEETTDDSFGRGIEDASHSPSNVYGRGVEFSRLCAATHSEG